MNKKCSHSVRLSSLCAHCGEELFTSEPLFNPLHTTDVLQTTEPQRSPRPTLVVDLDHTIVFTSLVDPRRASFSFADEKLTYFVSLRPFLTDFLDNVSRVFDLCVYTMGTRGYALKILSVVDQEKKYFCDRVITRDENNNKLVKKLSRLGVDEKDVVILDDRADIWGYEDNVVLIKPFYLRRERDFNDPVEIVKKGDCEASQDDVEWTEEHKNASFVGTCGEEDRELLNAARYLCRIFSKYKKTGNMKQVLRKERHRVFRKFFFYFGVEDPLAEIVRFYGGRFMSRSKLEAKAGCFVLKEGKKWRVVQKRWLYCCIYRRRRVPVEKYAGMAVETSSSEAEALEREYF
ncbi:UNVERIFIED_CONTAM: hypothetical protein PYX00_011805 [Menopon gallinae]|uniref:protein-serine/threonine phosphatase n=1 Tax=Menopon gallinae TaxID=328185 RepID=A0AAW2H8R8_9NEOP